MRIKLLCHVATSAQRDAVFADNEPAEESALQRLSALKHGWHLSRHCLVSPAVCAQQTAAALSLDVTADPALRDMDYGRWCGQTFATVQEREPEAVRAWREDADAAPHGGETLKIFLARIASWMDRQSERTGVVFAVTHAAVIRAAIVHALAAGHESFWRIDAAPLCLSSLSYGAGCWRLVSMNQIPLPRSRPE